MKYYLLHPAAVHFPIALLVVGFGLALAGRKRADAASWLLWLGTASAWAALALGLVAENYAPHVPPAWETLELHERLGWWTAGVATALSLWRWRWPERGRPLFLVAWAALVGLVLWTGSEGGELVYTFNMGTTASEG